MRDRNHELGRTTRTIGSNNQQPATNNQQPRLSRLTAASWRAIFWTALGRITNRLTGNPVHRPSPLVLSQSSGTMKLNLITAALVLLVSLPLACTAHAPPISAKTSHFSSSTPNVIVLSDSQGVRQGGVGTCLARARHDEHRGRRCRAELRLDQSRADRVQEDPAAHQRVRRRGSVLDGAGRGPVFDLLRQGGEVRTGRLADAGRDRHGAVQGRAASRATEPCSPASSH